MTWLVTFSEQLHASVIKMYIIYIRRNQPPCKYQCLQNSFVQIIWRPLYAENYGGMYIVNNIRI